MKANKKIKKRKCPVCNNDKCKFIIELNSYELVRCTKCSIVFVDIEETNSTEANIYENNVFYNYLNKEHIITAAYYDNILDKISKHYGAKKIKILEFGCGSGQFLLRAKNKGIDAYGLDFSPYSEVAKEKFNLNIETKNINNTAYEPDTFDVIISHATYEHIYELTDVTQKLLLLLKKKGLFIISGVPNFSLLSRILFNNYYLNAPPGHINYFEKRTIKMFFQKQNILPLKIKIYGADIWFLRRQINKIFKKKTTNTHVSKNYSEKEQQEIIDKFKNYRNNIKTKHKITAYFYSIIGRIYGKSIEAWGVKQ